LEQFSLNKRLAERRPIIRRSYREQATALSEAATWIEGLGIRVSATRIARYVKIIKMLADYHEGGDVTILRRKYGDDVLLNTLSECDTVIAIFDGLRTIVSPGLTERLKLFVAGRDLLFLETSDSNNIARNIGFELEIASAFAKAGTPIDLDHGDLSVQIEQTWLALECKRPFSYGKLESNLRDACQQLFLRYEADQLPATARGMVAVSISKVENAGRTVLGIQREDELSGIVDQLIENCVRTFRSVWARVRDPRTIAILLHLNVPAMVEDIKLLTKVRYFVYVNLASNPKDARVVRAVSDKIFDGQ
jgi:hypothetical protein